MVAGGTPKSDHYPHGAPPRGAAPAGLPWLDGVAPHSDAHRGYLDAAVARCRLPIRVKGDCAAVWIGRTDKRTGKWMHWPHASRAYLDLCRSLSASGLPPCADADTAAGASL